MPQWFADLIELLKKFFFGDSAPKLPEVPKVPEVPAPPKELKRRNLQLVPTEAKDNGLIVFNLRLREGKEVIDSVRVLSGQRYAQVLRRGFESPQGSAQPAPEGYYSVGTVEWASGKANDYSKSWGAGLGPVWIAIEPKMSTERSALGIHLDANYSAQPGTLGCLGVATMDGLKKLVTWFQDPRTRPQELTVNYGLGTVETAQVPLPEVPAPRGYTPLPGLWVWVESDLAKDTMQKAWAAGYRRVFIKAFDDASNPKQWPEITRSVVERWQAAGFSVWAWGYHFNSRFSSQPTAVAVETLIKLGFEGYVVDVEIEAKDKSKWESIDATLAHVAQRVGKDRLAFTSFGNRKWHPELPWEIFDRYCTYHMPQIYFEQWKLAQTETYQSVVKECMATFAGMKSLMYPIWGAEPGARYPATKEQIEWCLKMYPGSSVWRVSHAEDVPTSALNVTL